MKRGSRFNFEAVPREREKREREVTMVSEFERLQLRDNITLLRRDGLDRLFLALRCGAYHLTDIRGNEGIRRSSSIEPNDGCFPDTYPQSANSYGRLRNYVSLFDFETPTIRECLSMYMVWVNFFTRRGSAKVLLKLDRDRLVPNIIPNEAAKEEARREKKTWLRHVEVWYPEPIPFAWVTGCVLVLPTRPIEFSVYNADNLGLGSLDRALDAL